MRRLTALLVLALGLPPAPAAAAACSELDGYSRCDELVAMSDGVLLDATVYLPDGADGVPLVVRQHGGGSDKDNGYDVRYALDAVRTGRFAVLMYSHRGHGGSDGLYDFFGERTTLDTSEMLDHVADAYPQIDTSRIGMNGYSQGGGASLLPAARDPRVKAVAVGNTFDSLNEALNPNDCYKLSFATAIFALAYKASASRTQDDLALRWGTTFMTDTEDADLPGTGSTTADLASRSPVTYNEDIDIPVFWAQSWEDQLFPADMPERILAPLEARGIPVHYHFSSGGHLAPGGDHPDDIAMKERSMREWFEEFLLGMDHGFASGVRPKVDYWQRIAPGDPGGWEHHTAGSWPATNRAIAWSFSQLPAARIVNTFASANVANDAFASWSSRQIGMGETVSSIPEGPNPLDTARFAVAEPDADVHLVGSPSVRVHLLDGTLPQLAVKLWDEGPDGATLVSRGCVSGGATMLRLWPNAHTFPAGHRIVVTVSAVDEPTFKADTTPGSALVIGLSLGLPVR